MSKLEDKLIQSINKPAAKKPVAKKSVAKKTTKKAPIKKVAAPAAKPEVQTSSASDVNATTTASIPTASTNSVAHPRRVWPD
ncbi:MAG: hypothetical protein VW986_03865 [Gammaproteobacteria bacterium]|jgi:hypothetical protein